MEFGLKFAGAYNGIEGNFSPNQSHPLFTGVKSLYFNNGNSITDLKPESPLNQIVQTHSNGQGLIATAEFDPTEPTGIIDLYNTGVDNSRNVLGDSVADPHYTLTTSPAGAVTPAVTTPGTGWPGGWVANTTTSRWIGPNSPSANGPVGDYTYKTTFTLPSFSTASIVGELSVDDTITEILINGVSAGNTVPLGSYTTISKFSISTGFLVGINTLEFKVNSIGGPTGLRVDKIVGTYSPSLVRDIPKEQVLSQKWVQVPNSGSVIGITVLPNGTILGIGTDNLLYTRATLNSNWVQVPNSGSVIGVTVLPNGTILGIGTDNLLYTRATLNSNWVQVPNSGSVIGVTVLPNGTILGIGTDNLLYTRATLNSNWVQVPGSGSVIGITVFQNGTILGIGTDKLLYTRANLNSNWVQVPGSGSVIGITVLPNGTILGIGTDKLLWTKSI